MKTLNFVCLLFCLIFYSSSFAEKKGSGGENSVVQERGANNNALPNLIVDLVSFGFVEELTEGQRVGEMKYIIKNVGDAPAFSEEDDPNREGYVIDLILSNDDFLPAMGLAFEGDCVGISLLARHQGETIQPGEEIIFLEQDILLPTGCVDCFDSGFYERLFGVHIDPDNRVAESNNFDNHRFGAQPQRIKCFLPDLVVEGISFEAPIEGETVQAVEGQAIGTVKIKVRNIGIAPAELPYSIETFLSTDERPPLGWNGVMTAQAINPPDNVFQEDILLKDGGGIVGEVIQPNDVKIFRVETLRMPTNYEACNENEIANLFFGVNINPGNAMPELEYQSNVMFKRIDVKCKNE